jgi:diacylglycerol kinase (ATP)
MNECPHKGKTGLHRLGKAFDYSLDGLKSAWRYEAAFRQVFVLAIVGGFLVIWLQPPSWATSQILLAHFICLIVELVNSAIEAAVDHTSLEDHVLAKRAKDLGSAAQFVSLVLLASQWSLCIFAIV